MQYLSAQKALESFIPQEWRGLVSFNILQDGSDVYIVYRNYDVHSELPMMAGFRQVQGGRAGWDVVGPDPDVSGEGSEAWQNLQDHLLSLNHGIVSVSWPALLSYLIEANEAHCAKQMLSIEAEECGNCRAKLPADGMCVECVFDESVTA